MALAVNPPAGCAHSVGADNAQPQEGFRRSHHLRRQPQGDQQLVGHQHQAPAFVHAQRLRGHRIAAQRGDLGA
jgi:hypothetical protein